MSNHVEPTGDLGEPVVIGFSWYRPNTYQACLAVFDDAFQMHETYDEWLSDVLKTEKTVKSRGMTVIRVEIDPVEFPKWCVKEGFDSVDSRARSTFCSMEVKRIMEKRQRDRRKRKRK